MASHFLTTTVTLLVIAIFPLCSAVLSDKLKPGFYNDKCPQVEKIISDIVNQAVAKDRGMIPGILRLHFHDCFVTGCDATLLLHPERYNSLSTEQTHKANSITLRGVDVLYQVKKDIEKQCPGVVSCADIMAYAARDVVVLAGNPTYTVPAGRRDGSVINSTVPIGLPRGNDSIPILKSRYEQRGLALEDMVALEAAHSVGKARCGGTIANPDNFHGLEEYGKHLDKNFQEMVKSKYCNDPSNFGTTYAPFNPEKGDSDWGVSFYNNILAGKGLLLSDLGMAVDSATKDLVQSLAKDPTSWKSRFNEAVIKIGKINVMTGEEGEIRSDCAYINAVNKPASKGAEL